MCRVIRYGWCVFVMAIGLGCSAPQPKDERGMASPNEQPGAASRKDQPGAVSQGDLPGIAPNKGQPGSVPHKPPATQSKSGPKPIVVHPKKTPDGKLTVEMPRQKADHLRPVFITDEKEPGFLEKLFGGSKKTGSAPSTPGPIPAKGSTQGPPSAGKAPVAGPAPSPAKGEPSPLPNAVQPSAK